MPLLFSDPIVDVLPRVVAGTALAAAIAIASQRAGALTRSGATAAVAVGAVTFAFGGVLVAAAVIIFFATGSLLGRVSEASTRRGQRVAAKGATRDAAQVFANGGVATICAFAGGVIGVHNAAAASHWLIAAVCALAAASGDTWSTEIGALAGGRVRRITDMRSVPLGASGGVTVAGTLAAPLGGAVVGLAGLLRADLLAPAAWLALGAIAGLAGSLIDSLLGATAQGIWCCSNCGQTIETPVHPACGTQAERVRGTTLLNNDGVNFAMTLAGAGVGYAISLLV